MPGVSPPDIMWSPHRVGAPLVVKSAVSYRRLVQSSSSTRTYLRLRDDLVESAVALARPRGDNLSDIVRAAIITATKAALRGDGARLPRQLPRVRGVAGAAQVGYVAPREEIEQCDAALVGAGSSRRAVATAALEAYVAAGGDRVVAAVPGEVVAA